MVKDQVDQILDLDDVQHNCGLSRVCPAWVCEEQIGWMEIKTKINVLTNDLEMISLEESKEEEMNTDERDNLDNEIEMEDDKDFEMKVEENLWKITSGRQSTSDEDDSNRAMEADQDLLQPPGMEVESRPVKDLISRFEMLNKDNLQDNPSKKIKKKKVGKIPDTLRVKFEERKDHTIEVDNLHIGWNNPANSEMEKHSVDENMVEITITKPDTSPTQTDESLNPRRKPEVRKSLPTQKLVKRRVWTKLKSGLFGWKSLQNKQTTSANLHRRSAAESKPKIVENYSANRLSFKVDDWLLTASMGSGGGENRSEILLDTRKYSNNSLVGKRIWVTDPNRRMNLGL